MVDNVKVDMNGLIRHNRLQVWQGNWQANAGKWALKRYV